MILTILFGLFSLPALIFGLYLFACWFRIHTSDVYYVDYPYIPAGFILVAVGAFSLFCVVYGAWRRSFYGLLFAIPLMLGLMTMVYIPDGTPRVQRSLLADSTYLSSVASFFRVWYEANHQFPANESEFQDALRKGPAAWQYSVKSPSQLSFYSQAGKRLPYEIIVLNDATGPRMDNVSTRPAVIYYCVSHDQQEFWVTMTVLNDDVARTASLKNLTIGAAGKDYPTRKTTSSARGTELFWNPL